MGTPFSNHSHNLINFTTFGKCYHCLKTKGLFCNIKIYEEYKNVPYTCKNKRDIFHANVQCQCCKPALEYKINKIR